MAGWCVTKMHEHCKECSECAANAVGHALKTNGVRASSAYMNVTGPEATILHQADVELKLAESSDVA